MRLQTPILMLMFFVGFTLTAGAQDFALDCPAKIQAGESFTVKVTPDPPATAAYSNWTVTNGRMTGGSRPPFNINTSVPANGQDMSVRISVQINNDAPRIEKIASCVVAIVPGISPSLVDEYMRVTEEEIQARLDSFFIQLGNDPTAQGYIINSGTNRDISRREAAIRQFIAARKFDAARITIVRNTSISEIHTQVWLVPAGAKLPEIGVTTLRAAQSVDEYGAVNPGEMTARMDAFAASLNNDPEARGYIVFYRDRNLPGRAARQAQGMLSYLKFRNIDKRINVYDGGVRNGPLTQMSIIQPAGALPLLKNDAADLAQPKARLKFDEYNIYFAGEDEAEIDDYSGAFEQSSRLSDFALQLEKFPAIKGQIVYYRQTGETQAKVRQTARKEKDYLVNTLGITASRITLVSGGAGAQRKLELWLQPIPRSRRRR